ncbi:MAG TPA: ABC transporter ATP-binding protein [Sphingobacteriaceae bacterium]
MLEIRGLNVEFKTESTWFHAVNNVSFTLETGKVIGIVGESGSGKSVTSLAVMRLHDEQSARISGSVLLNEIELLNLPEDQMQSIRGNRISMIFQEPMTSLNPVFTCGFQVAEAIQQHQSVNRRIARKKTIELFKEVQLPRPENIFDSYPHQLSGGQKQRVMIAMALSCNPEILIADEPTTALDVTVQKTILDLLLRLKDERNMSLIFISHDLGVIGEIADEVVVMYQGKIVEKASIQDIFSNPQHPYTRGLLACRPSPTRKLRKLPVVSDFLEKSPEGETITKNANVSAFLDQLALTEQEIVNRKRNLYSQSPILRVVGLQTWYPIKRSLFYRSKEFVKAVDDVSLEVFPGETLGLVGESGCGKTTLGRSILRLVEPTGGKIFFKDTDLNKLSAGEMRRYRKNMQIIFQDPYSALNPRLTVGQSIMEPMQVHQVYANNKLRKDHVMQLLERVNLNPDHFNRYPHEFSGGQRQRISIARALALQPELIICDESVSALDVSVQAQVLNLLKELQTEFNLTYIFISHDLAVVKHISDRMIVMNQGKIEEQGDPDDIYNTPKNPYTKKLIDAIPKHN